MCTYQSQINGLKAITWDCLRSEHLTTYPLPLPSDSSEEDTDSEISEMDEESKQLYKY